jgi:hypothetical protein
MTTKYKQEAAVGEIYHRCNAVRIENPLVGSSTVHFSEEIVYASDLGAVKNPINGFSIEVDPAAEIPILDTATGEPTGVTVTHAYIYQCLHSLYMQKAQQRDEKEIARLTNPVPLAPEITPGQP